jgi:radical SAM superfamily enzyme YgiQ (UPF0313 family)
MRVLFVYPNLYTQMGFNHGLASLSAGLKAAGHATRMLNLNENLPPVPTLQDVLDEVRAWRPGLIGFSCLTMQYPEALRIARWLRQTAEREGLDLPPLVVGGIHPTMVPEEVMADSAWDHVGVGECEDALAELVRRLEAGVSTDDVPNFLCWKGGLRGGEWVRNGVGEFPDLTSLPAPDYGLFDTQRILDAKQGWFGLLSSRGCPYRCTYCLNHRIVDTYRSELGRSVTDLGFFRYRPIDLLIEEIREVLATYQGIGTFILDDDLFTQNPDHAIAFCEAYSAAGFDVPFVVNSHVKRLDPRVAAALGRAGCRILKLGIESGSQRVRSEVLKRFMTDADILATVATGEEHGLHTSGFVMVGLPGETHAERWETVDILARSAIGRFRTSLFYPFPGTESYRLSIEGGYIDPSREATLTDFTESSCLDFGERENLLVDKLAVCMPWFVNARLDRWHDAPAARRYGPIAEEVLAMDRDRWQEFKPEVSQRDAELSQAAAAAGELHYAIRFNSFMGVRSDYYLAEEQGVEWSTASARPVPERLRDLALAAAASQSC